MTAARSPLIVRDPTHFEWMKSSSKIERHYSLKMKVIGDDCVGKTRLILRFSEGTYTESYISKIGNDMKMRDLKLDELTMIRTQLWDTAGQERFRCVKSNHDRRHDICFVVFDLTNTDSFNKIEQLVDNHYRSDDKKEKAILILVGTKSDLISNRQVEHAEIEDYIFNKSKHKGKFEAYFETSAKLGTNLEKLFRISIQLFLSKYYPKEFGNPMTNQTNVLANGVEARQAAGVDVNDFETFKKIIEEKVAKYREEVAKRWTLGGLFDRQSKDQNNLVDKLLLDINDK